MTRYAVLFLALVLAACGGSTSTTGDDAGSTSTADYEDVEAIFMTSCAFATCHGGSGVGAAELNFASAIAAGRSLTEVLNDVPSCQYDALPLVDPGNPDGSWLMIKLVGPHTAGRIDFTPDASWDPGITRDGMGRYPASICPLTQDGEITFGVLMPQGSMTGLSAERVDVVRRWIAAGAPGPSGG